MSAGGGGPQRRQETLRVAFQPFGGADWLGGLHYLTTLLAALAEHARDDVEAVLVVPADVDRQVMEALQPHVGHDPIILPRASQRAKAADGLRRRAAALERACRTARVDVVYQHAGWLGSGFGIPTLAWLGDFQHRVLPGMFGRRQRWRREMRFQAVLRTASLLYVLSEADRSLGGHFYPAFAPKLRSLPFAVAPPDDGAQPDPIETRDRYGLPPKFLLFPGQHWRHKNHLGVIEAVALLKRSGQEVVVVSCGNPVDLRDRSHGPRVAARRAELGVEEQVRVLGLVPRQDVWALLRASAGVINPSFYEGWSTPVEEAKSVGAPLLLSDLPVHREQRPASAVYFDPHDAVSIAAGLDRGWRTGDPGPRPDAERRAALELGPRRHAFAQGFASLARAATASGPAGNAVP